MAVFGVRPGLTGRRILVERGHRRSLRAAPICYATIAMVESATRMPSTIWAVLALALASCATGSFQRSSFSLIVEGAEASYPAFEAAAKACGYTAYQHFPGGIVQNNITVAPHYNLSRIDSRAATCTVRWVNAHPELGLRASGE